MTNFHYRYFKNLSEPLPLRLIRETKDKLIFSDSSRCGWLFILCGITLLGLASFAHFNPEAKQVGIIIFGGTGAICTIGGLISIVFPSTLVIDLSTSSYTRKRAYWIGMENTNGSLSKLTNIIVQKRIYYLRGVSRYPIWLIGLTSRDWQEPLMLEATHNENKALSIAATLNRHLNIPINYLETRDTQIISSK